MAQITCSARTENPVILVVPCTILELCNRPTYRRAVCCPCGVARVYSAWPCKCALMKGPRSLDACGRRDESAYSDQQYIVGMLANGARGYLTKDEVPFKLSAAIRSVAAGDEIS